MADHEPQSFSHYPGLPSPGGIALVVLPEHPCPYLPGRPARNRALWADRMAPAVYGKLMDAGFRRSGRVVYQPVCGGCRQCTPLRVRVAHFTPDKSQRRCARRNTDLQVRWGPPFPTDEKYALYRRYLRDWHGGRDDGVDVFESFLYDSPVDTIEFEYRTSAGSLLGVGLCDRCPRVLSSVYFYFDPAESRRGLGTFGALAEIEYARSQNLEYYYLGYWVHNCAAMEYKSGYRPTEVLCTDGIWRAGPRL